MSEINKISTHYLKSSYEKYIKMKYTLLLIRSFDHSHFKVSIKINLAVKRFDENRIILFFITRDVFAIENALPS